MKAQYGILRFKKYKGPAISPIEAHNERTKEQYASNPDIDTSRSRYNLHLVQPQGRYREEADRMITAAHCRVRKDSVRVVEALVTASPEFFKDKTNREIRAYFAYALKFLEGRQCPDTFLSAVVHMDEKTPHLHLCFVPLTPDGRLSAKEIIGNRKNLVKWQDEFWQHMVKQYPELERGESASQTGREHIPPRIFKEMTQLTKQRCRWGVFSSMWTTAERKVSGHCLPSKNFRAYAKYALISRLVLSLKNSGLAVTRASTTRTLSLRTRQ